MGRPPDGEYYVDNRTEHVAQGDVFRDVPFTWVVAPSGGAVGFAGYGMLITYTSGMMLQPPGTKGYKHSYRLLAPVLSFPALMDIGFSEEQLLEVRRSDKYMSMMYLPAYPDEFPESAALPYRATLVHQDVLENRITQLQGPAALQLQLKLATAFLGGKWDPDDLKPDQSDHWNP
ncbi:MAG: hypothetical protein ACR2KQ_03585 [Actinomycetota bacterium]